MRGRKSEWINTGVWVGVRLAGCGQMGLWRAVIVRLRNDVSTHRNTLEPKPLESRPHRTLEIGMVCLEGDQMIIPDSLFAKHTSESNISTS